jgi:hypothetical protein
MECPFVFRPGIADNLSENLDNPSRVVSYLGSLMRGLI